jgi:hypothetical protein
VWISLVVPFAVLVLAVLLQRLEAAVLRAPDAPGPRRHDEADLPDPTDPGPVGGDPVAAPVAPARPVCATHRRPARARRVIA